MVWYQGPVHFKKKLFEIKHKIKCKLQLAVTPTRLQYDLCLIFIFDFKHFMQQTQSLPTCTYHYAQLWTSQIHLCIPKANSFWKNSSKADNNMGPCACTEVTLFLPKWLKFKARSFLSLLLAPWIHWIHGRRNKDKHIPPRTERTNKRARGQSANTIQNCRRREGKHTTSLHNSQRAKWANCGFVMISQWFI